MQSHRKWLRSLRRPSDLLREPSGHLEPLVLQVSGGVICIFLLPMQLHENLVPYCERDQRNEARK